MTWLTKRNALRKLPALLIQRSFSYDFDGIPVSAKHLPFEKTVNLLKCGLDTLIPFDRQMALPPSIQVEPTNICNLNCPLCPTGSTHGKRKKGFMSLERFRSILHELGDILVSLILYSWGEPFLNRDLPAMIAECTARNILTITSTNGNCKLTLDDALKVVDSGLSVLVIALDGSNQEIYQRYRRGGDVEKVKRFASLITEAKIFRGSELPYTNIRAVVTRENEKDLPNIEGIARSLGMNMFSMKSVGDFVDISLFNKFEPSSVSMRRYAGKGTTHRPNSFPRCPYPFRQPTIFWDGTVVGCEFDYDFENSWGMVGEKRLAHIWNCPEARDLRKGIRKGKYRASFCRICPYKGRHEGGTVLYCVEL
jgi:MoaA/NifB/PqqE/SkfB family radical SAM enzyme